MNGLWPLIVAFAVVTYVYRVSFLVTSGRRRLPARLSRALALLPVAIVGALFSNLFLSQLERPGGAGGADLARGLALLPAAFVAWRTKSTLATIVTGMLVLWTLQALVPVFAA